MNESQGYKADLQQELVELMNVNKFLYISFVIQAFICSKLDVCSVTLTGASDSAYTA